MLIAQLSDPHLRPPGMLYGGLVDSNALFALALRHLDAMRPRPDLVLVTGDIADDGAPDTYDLARALLAGVASPLLVIPGNHDERDAFRRAFPRDGWGAPGPLHAVEGGAGPVRVVALDVTVPGEHHGEAGAEALGWLDRALAAEPGRPTLVAMHQPPILTGVPYLDAYACRDAEALAAVLARHPRVERVACGHVHRAITARFGGTVLCTAPSTAAAIALRPWPDAEPASFLEPPGLLLHRWTPEGGVVTHLVPVGAFPGPLPLA